MFQAHNLNLLQLLAVIKKIMKIENVQFKHFKTRSSVEFIFFEGFLDVSTQI